MAAFLMTPVKWLHSKGGKESVKAKCEEAEAETEELIKLIHLVGSEGQERQAEEISHSLLFSTLYESYHITGCILKPLSIYRLDVFLITLPSLLTMDPCFNPQYELK